jgi:hypothetical protein
MGSYLKDKWRPRSRKIEINGRGVSPRWPCDTLLSAKVGSAKNRTRDLWVCSQEVWPLDHRGGLHIDIEHSKISLSYTESSFSWKSRRHPSLDSELLGVLDFVHRPEICKPENTPFRVLDLISLKMPYFGMLRRVVFVRTDVSEELSASITRVTRIGELGTTLAVTSNRRIDCCHPDDGGAKFLRNVGSYKIHTA